MNEETIKKNIKESIETDHRLRQEKYNCPKKECCCKCLYHHPLFGHPWVDGKQISDQDGYVCVPPEFEGKAVKAKVHGLCEMFREGKQ